jgi:hypothetical protein
LSKASLPRRREGSRRGSRNAFAKEEAMADLWYYAQNGQQLGPVPSEQLQQLAAGGQLQPFDLIWKEGMPSWVEASTVQGLYQHPGPVPAAPRPPAPYADARAADPYRPSPPRRRAAGMSTGAKVAIGVGVGGGLLVVIVVVVLVLTLGRSAGGAVTGPKTWSMNVPGIGFGPGGGFNNNKVIQTVTFKPGRADFHATFNNFGAMIDVQIFDTRTNLLVTQGMGIDGHCDVEWTVSGSQNQTYRIEILNQSPFPVVCTLRHN